MANLTGQSLPTTMTEATQEQDGNEHHWLIDLGSGQISLWTEDGGLDGEHPVDLDEVDLIGIHPLPSYVWDQDHVWYQDMAHFVVADSVPRSRPAIGAAHSRVYGVEFLSC